MPTIQVVHQTGHEAHGNPFHGNEILLLESVFVIDLLIIYLLI